MRGEQLEFFNLYEFVAIIVIILLPKEKSNILEKTKYINEEKEAEVEGEEKQDEEAKEEKDEEIEENIMNETDFKSRSLGR